MLYPVKKLYDEDGNPFLPFVITDAVYISGTNKTLAEYLEDCYLKAEVDAKFAALGTVMNFKGTLTTKDDLPADASPGDVYLVGGDDLEGYIYYTGGWEDLGKLVDLSDYPTSESVTQEIADAVDANAATLSTALQQHANEAAASALNSSKTYTDQKVATKQDPLVSGIDIKTINGESVLGTGDITVAAEVDREVIALTGTEFTLEVDKKYSATITEDTTITLPVLGGTDFHQIMLFLEVQGTPNITWGTTWFFNGEIPNVLDKHSNVIFEYDGARWVMGAVAKGAVN